MTDRLRDKFAIVTGAAQGIGRATALAFAGENARVLAADVNLEALESLQREQPGLTIEPLDVCDREAIANLAERLGPIDVLFNCVGMVHHGTVLECDEEAWRRTLEVNVTSMYRMIRAFLPGMLTAGRGSIVNVSSVVSSVTGAPHRCAYGASKAAVIGLTKSIAADYVGAGIRCNAICPGTVQSPSLEDRLAASGDYDAAKRAFIARQPMGRLGRPEEIAHLAVYLASDESSYTTGAVHVADGGWSM